MRNQLATQMRRARRTGVTDGIEFMSGLFIIALNNVADDYVDEEKLDQFFIEMEKEVNRLYQQTMDSVPSGEITEMAEKIVYHVGEIRKKRGMDG